MPECEFSIAEERARLAEHAAELRRRLLAGADGFVLAAARSAAVDAVVVAVFAAVMPAELRDGVAVLAVGGYGRRHLAPHSDIDLLFLHRRDPALDVALARLGRALWDVGLKPANVCLCIDDVPDDPMSPETATACLETRRVAGSPAVFAAFDELFAARLERVRLRLATRLIQELDMDCVQAVRELNRIEPDLKQGPFLLRDTQRVYWVSTLLAPAAAATGFGCSAFLKTDERERLNAAYGFFLRVRGALHFLAGRQEDVILIQYQAELTRQLGFAAQGQLRAEELFLRALYGCTRRVYLASRQIVELAENDARLEPLSRRRLGRTFISPGFVRLGRHLHFGEAPERWWSRAPGLERLLEPFVLLQQTRLLMPYAMLNTLRRAAENCPEPEGASVARVGAAFRQILGAHQPVGPLLAQAHFAGVLERVLPEFGALTCAAQLDPRHQYTVDAHSLLVVTEFDTLFGTAPAREVEPYRIVFGAVQDLSVLRLAALLHDCGKACEGSHAKAGAPLAAAAAARLGFGPEAQGDVEFLVREHLLLSAACQQRDIEDPALLATLAEKAGTRRWLNMLLLLTFADMRCVRQGVWTGWKGDQLWTLYHRIARRLEEAGDGQTDFAREFALYRPTADAPVTRPALETHVAQMAWSEYAEHVPFDRIVEHAGAAAQHAPGGVEVRVFQRPHVTRIRVVADDRQGLFSRLVGALTASRLLIVQGWCFTRRDGVVIDEVEVQDVFTGHHVAESAWPEIEATLRRILTGQESVEDVMARHRRTFPVPAPTSHRAAVSAQVDNSSSQHFTIIDVRAGDRAGLLFDLGCTLERFRADVRFVKISTQAGQGADSFYVVSGTGMKLAPAVAAQLAKAMEAAGATMNRR